MKNQPLWCTRAAAGWCCSSVAEEFDLRTTRRFVTTALQREHRLSGGRRRRIWKCRRKFASWRNLMGEILILRRRICRNMILVLLAINCGLEDGHQLYHLPSRLSSICKTSSSAPVTCQNSPVGASLEWYSSIFTKKSKPSRYIQAAGVCGTYYVTGPPNFPRRGSAADYRPLTELVRRCHSTKGFHAASSFSSSSPKAH